MFRMTSKSLFGVILFLGCYFSFPFCMGFNLHEKQHVCKTDACIEAAQTLLDSMDKSQDPCKDFYAYTCNRYKAKHSFLNDTLSINVFQELADKIKKIIREILERPYYNDMPEIKKAKNMYAQCMKNEDNTEIMKDEINKLGGWPILSKIRNHSRKRFSLENLLAKTSKKGVRAIVSTFVDSDLKHTSKHILTVQQGNVPLGRSSILGKNRNKKLIHAYRKFIVTCVNVLGSSRERATDIDKEVEDIIDFETKLTKLTKNPQRRHNFLKEYNKLTISDLQQETDPSGKIFDWNVYFNELMQVELESNEPIMVVDLAYTKNVMQLIYNTKYSTVVNYVMWVLIKSYSWHAGGELHNAHFEFEKVLNGIQRMNARWFSCVTVVDMTFGYAISKPFVDKHFSRNSKRKVLQLIKSVHKAYIERLGDVSFLDEATRRLAKQKAATMRWLIGYPWWIQNNAIRRQHYAKYPFMKSDHLTNVMSAVTVTVTNGLKLLRKPVYKQGFAFSPITVNAEFQMTKNAITVPAAILQTPFFEAGRPVSLNYGAIGSILAHEMTHGYDDEGRQTNQNGDLADWWPKKAIRAFTKRTQCFIKQYDKYCPSELANTTKLCINGEVTLGENIADNGGVRQSFTAFKTWLAANGPEDKLPGLEEYTSEQIFFLGFAHLYCSSDTPNHITNYILYSPHSLARYRVMGPLSNSKDFAEAFGCSKGPMNRGSDRCVLW